MRFLIVLLLSTALLATTAASKPTRKERRILRDASSIVETVTATPDRSIPDGLLRDAECIGAFPRVKKGAFVIGGTHGRGVVSCRDAAGRMGAPAFYSISAASLGFQIGGSSTDLVFLVMNQDSIEHLVSNQVRFGAEASAAAGPVGRTAKASTDAQMQAQVLSWSRSRGLFAGVSLEGAVLEASEDANERLYEEPTSARSILIGHERAVPAIADAFVRTIRERCAR